MGGAGVHFTPTWHNTSVLSFWWDTLWQSVLAPPAIMADAHRPLQGVWGQTLASAAQQLTVCTTREPWDLFSQAPWSGLNSVFIYLIASLGHLEKEKQNKNTHWDPGERGGCVLGGIRVAASHQDTQFILPWNFHGAHAQGYNSLWRAQ